MAREPPPLLAEGGTDDDGREVILSEQREHAGRGGGNPQNDQCNCRSDGRVVCDDRGRLAYLTAWVASSETKSTAAERDADVEELKGLLSSFIDYHRAAKWLPAPHRIDN